MSNHEPVQLASTRTVHAPSDAAPFRARPVAPGSGRKPAGILRSAAPVVFRSGMSLLLLGVAVGAFVALGRSDPPATDGPTTRPAPLVEVAPVERHTEGMDFDVDGVVVPFQQVDVPAEVAGRIAFRSENCRVGRTVARGELLLRIDAQDYELEVRRLEEMLRQAQAEIHELTVERESRLRQIALAEEDLAIKRREVARYERIDDPGVYSKSELDAARLKELQARASLQTERDQSSLLEARHGRLTIACELVERQLEKARLDRLRTEIRAPIDGIVVREPVEQGCYVQRGGVVAVIQDVSRMEIKCSLRMHQMHWLWQGVAESSSSPPESPAYRFPDTPATIIYKVGDAEYSWNGTLSDFDGAQIDQQTRMVPCRVFVPNPRGASSGGKSGTRSSPAAPPGLMAGMFVAVRVHARPRIPLFRVPEAAVQPGNRLWRVDAAAGEDSRLGRLRQVRANVAYRGGTTALVYGSEPPLSEGDLIVSSPVAHPSEGMAVEMLRPGEPIARSRPAEPAGKEALDGRRDAIAGVRS